MLSIVCSKLQQEGREEYQMKREAMFWAENNCCSIKIQSSHRSVRLREEEGVDLVLWGDLRTMFDANAEDELWQNQERWNLKSWDLYENCDVHTLILEDGTEIHMLAEKKYPLTKETLERMLSLRLIVGTASEDAYTLLRFIQGEKDL
ncbi:hypothetical protein Tco_0089292 [Tanacetum coccineum]